MSEGLFRGKCKENGEWVEGNLILEPFGYFIQTFKKSQNGYERKKYAIIPETAGEYIGLIDINGYGIFEGDIVKLLDFQVGKVVQECGSFGIAIMPCIDWDYLDSEICNITGCNNVPDFCRNDNFISFWEIMWNYNQEEHCCEVVEVIGNIHDGIKQENNIKEGKI
ncbi:MAG: YopX family protein [Acutalibacteraceae bacterium]